jgi:hypothetical protein
MKLLPFEKITLETKLTGKEIIERFAGFIEPENIFRLKILAPDESKMPYEGTISNHQFKIQRITNDLRANTPVIIGDIENEFNSSLMKLRIRPRISQMIGLCIWLAVVGYNLTINFLVNSFDIFTLFLFAMLIYAYFFMMRMFNNESLRAKIDLQKLLEAREV